MATVLLVGLHAAAARAADYTYTLFDVPGGSSTYAFGINDGGTIVGSTHAVGYLKVPGGDLVIVKDAGARKTHPYAVNDHGVVAGFLADGRTIRGFERRQDAVIPVDVPGAAETFAFGINDADQIAGTFATADGTFGFTRKDGVFSTLAVPGAVVAPGKGTQAHGINGRGDVVGFFNKGRDAATGKTSVGAFVCRAGAFTTFDVPGAYATEANGINDAGLVVGTYGTAGGGRGFVYDGTTFTTLSVPGASKTEAQGINNKGQVVGWAVVAGATRGFVATPR